MQESEAEEILKKYNIKDSEIKKLARIRYINESVIFLRNAGLYYEAILFSSQVIEVKLRDLIWQCEKTIDEVVKKRSAVKYEKNSKLEKKTLGELIFLIKRRSKNIKLINDLEEFLEIRNKIAHNLITTDQDIKEIEKYSSGYVKSGKIFALFKLILDESNRIMLNQLEIDLKDNGLEMPKYLTDKLKK